LSDVATWLPGLGARPEAEQRRELELARLRLRQERLRTEHQEVLALMGDASEHQQRVEAASLLTRLAQQLREIETALATRDGIGSMVWRSRQAGEALGG
jgi:hypothetical protein